MRAISLIIVVILVLISLYFESSMKIVNVEKAEHAERVLGPKIEATKDWVQFRGDPLAQGVAQGFIPDKPSLLWKKKIGVDLKSSPSIKADHIYIGSGDNKIYALNRKTGDILWNFETQDVIEATPLILNNKVYVGSADYNFYCLDALKGKKIWSKETDGKVLASANFYEIKGRYLIIIGSYDGRLFALDAETGKTEWVYDTDNYVNATAIISGNTAYFGSCDEQIHAVNLRDGKSINTLGLDEPVPGSGTMFKEFLFFGTHGGRFLCYDSLKKSIAWDITDREDGYYATASVNENNLIIAGRDKVCLSLDYKTGKIKWEQKLRSSVDSSPLIVREKLVLGTKSGKVKILNLKDGSLIWEYDVGSPIIGSISFSRNHFFVPVSNGYLYCFGAKMP